MQSYMNKRKLSIDQISRYRLVMVVIVYNICIDCWLRNVQWQIFHACSIWSTSVSLCSRQFFNSWLLMNSIIHTRLKIGWLFVAFCSVANIRLKTFKTWLTVVILFYVYYCLVNVCFTWNFFQWNYVKCLNLRNLL